MGALRFPPRYIFRRLLLSLLMFNKSQGPCQLISLWDVQFVRTCTTCARHNTHTHNARVMHTTHIHYTHTSTCTHALHIYLYTYLRFRGKLYFRGTLTGFSFLTPGSRARSSCSLFMSFTGRLPTYLPFISFIACSVESSQFSLI